MAKTKNDRGQKRRQLTAWEKARIALDRFAPLAEGKSMTPNKTLAKKYDRAEAVISRAIASAFKEKLVEVRRIDQPTTRYRRDTMLEDDIRAAFPELHNTIVIDNEDVREGEGEAERGDLLHRRLGQAMAEELAQSLVFRTGDIVGLGSGRGVYFTVEALRRLPPLRTNDMTLMSLTGAVFPKAHSDRFRALLDADLHVALMAICFEAQVKLKVISYPIALVDMDKARKNTWLDKEEFDQRIPSHALIGVGVLDRGHRFYELVKHDDTEDPGILAPIYDDLVNLVKLSDKVRAQYYYCPVADICNRLFLVESPHVHRKADRNLDTMLDNLTEMIEELNNQLLTVQQDQLEKIDRIMLVAGTQKKALAILRFLEKRDLKIRLLCTDAEAAREILRLKTVEGARPF